MHANGLVGLIRICVDESGEDCWVPHPESSEGWDTRSARTHHLVIPTGAVTRNVNSEVEESAVSPVPSGRIYSGFSVAGFSVVSCACPLWSPVALPL